MREQLDSYTSCAPLWCPHCSTHMENSSFWLSAWKICCSVAGIGWNHLLTLYFSFYHHISFMYFPHDLSSLGLTADMYKLWSLKCKIQFCIAPKQMMSQYENICNPVCTFQFLNPAPNYVNPFNSLYIKVRLKNWPILDHCRCIDVSSESRWFVYIVCI